MDHIVSDREVGIALDPLSVRRELPGGLFFVFAPDQLCVRQNGQPKLRILDAGRDRTDRNAAFPELRQLLQFRPDQDRHPVFPEILLQDLRPPLVPGEDDDPVVLFQVDFQILCGRLRISRIGGELLGRNAEQGLRRETAPAQGKGVACTERKAIQFLPDPVGRETEAVRIKGTEPLFLQRLQVFSELLAVFSRHLSAACRLVQKDKGILRDIVKPGGGRIQQRQPAVQIRHHEVRADFLCVLAHGRCEFPRRRALATLCVAVCQLFQLPGERFRAAFCQGRQRLCCRENPALRDALLPALG